MIVLGTPVMLVAAAALAVLRARQDWRRRSTHRRAMLPVAIQLLLLLFAVPLGIWHWKLGNAGIFVFRNGEPLSSWVAVISGVLSTLPLVVLSIWSPRWGGWGLLVGAVVSGCAVVSSDWPNWQEHLPGLVTRTAGPASVLGLGLIGAGRLRAWTFAVGDDPSTERGGRRRTSG